MSYTESNCCVAWIGEFLHICRRMGKFIGMDAKQQDTSTASVCTLPTA